MNRLQDISAQLNTGEGTEKFIYSVPVGPKVKDETQIHRKPTHKDKLLEIPSHYSSLSAFWDDCVKRHSKNLLSEDFTFAQMDEMARRVGSWLVSRGHKLFFLYCLNSPNWTITDIATWNYGLINVPLYDTLGAEAFNHILKITEGTLLFTTKNLLNSLYGFLSKNKFNVREVCLYDDISNEDRQKF